MQYVPVLPPYLDLPEMSLRPLIRVATRAPVDLSGHKTGHKLLDCVVVSPVYPVDLKVAHEDGVIVSQSHPVVNTGVLHKLAQVFEHPVFGGPAFPAFSHH